MPLQVATPEVLVFLQGAHCFALTIDNHRTPIHEGWGRAAPHSRTARMKGLFGHRADVFQDRAAVQPSLVWIWPCSNNAQDAFCESCKSMIRLES